MMDMKQKPLMDEEQISTSQPLLPAAEVSGWNRFQEESKRLWAVTGPTIITRTAMYGLQVITLAFCGHLGDTEFAAMSIATTVIVGFNFSFFLGMASALETLAGQAYGVGQYRMLGVLLQRSWILLLILATALLPLYIFATPILILLGQPSNIAELCGFVAVTMIPMHYVFPILLPLQRYLQCQSKNYVYAIFAVVAWVFHWLLCWLLIIKGGFGLVGAAMSLNLSWWIPCIGSFVYVTCGGCPQTWHGISKDSVSLHALWAFFKLSLASGVMISLEDWYYKALVLVTGHLPNAELEIDSLAVCMNIYGWEMMIPLSFLAGVGVRVGNELGSGKGQKAKYAVTVAVTTSTCIGIIAWALILLYRNKIGVLFTDSAIILHRVSTLSLLLAFTVLLNSVQPVLSGVAVGIGWQAYVAYVNVGCYYIIGVPVGVFLGWVFHLGVLGIWTGMICGTFLQTIILSCVTFYCDWDTEALEAIHRVQRLSTGGA